MTVRYEWLADRLANALRWQLANPGRREDPDTPEIPAAGLRVWRIFCDLSRARGSNGWGPSPLSHVEIEAYARLRREPIRPFELDMLATLDAAYIKAADRSEEGGKQVISSRPMSIELFDAMFDGGR